MVRKQLPILIFLILAVYGCNSTRYIYHPDELYLNLSERLSHDQIQALDIPFETTPEMVEYAKRLIKRSDSAYKNAVRIVDAIITEWEVTYERTADYTAAQVFHETRKANCLSFTHLFVSLARSAGIRAHYVDVQHDELLSESNLAISSRHICAGIIDGGMFYLLDFDPRPQKTYRMFQIIDDVEAIANHYNNLAINGYTLDRSRLDESLDILDKALVIKPDFSRALNNRGVLQHISGRTREAEFSFRQAVMLDPELHEANANLSGVLLARNAISDSLEYAHRAIQSRPNNIQYQMRLGMIYFYLMDYESAYREFQRVTRRYPHYTRGFHGLAISAFHLGMLDTAERAILRAVELNPVSQEYLSFQVLVTEKLGQL